MATRVVVVGGGGSGVIVASAWLRRSGPPVAVAIVESEQALGRGVAYGTSAAVHLLNVPAAAMSARPDDPGHFLRWLRRRDPSAHERSFAPRALYSAYLREALEEARAESAAGSTLEHVRDRAVAVRRFATGTEVRLAGGGARAADHVVLATGYAPPAALAAHRREDVDPERLVTDPWAPGALDLAHGDRSVLVLGTGLTAVDVVLALRHRGHGGVIYGLSRHGLLPRPHAGTGPAPAAVSWHLETPTALHLLQHARTAARRHDWRSVLDSVRPHAQGLWRALPLEERRRFLRHLRSYWDVHRHRLPPTAADVVQGMVDCGRLRVRAGRVESLARDVDGVRVTIVERGQSARSTLVVGHVIDCTGPGPLAGTKDPLLRGLLEDGLARLDSLGLGLDADADGALIGRDGLPSRWLYAVGPLLKGTCWETTSVPEIREQARAMTCALGDARV
jgi:uncharacterized NAD(P)/FAD-binding protein YdhS